MSTPERVAAVDIRPGDLRTVRAILSALFSEETRVWVFGSRATGRARRGSDLDLAIDAGRPITPAEGVALAEAFDDSDLPYAVDVVDMRLVSERFKEIVRRERTPLPEGGGAGARDAVWAGRSI